MDKIFTEKLNKKDCFFVGCIVIGIIVGAVLNNALISVGIVVLLWLLMIILGLIRKEASPFDIKSTTALRGICAIEILLGHVGLFTGNMALFANRKAGILIVGLFFMLSGYGLSYAYNHKKDYLVGFLPRRIFTLLLPVAVVLIIDRIINMVFLNNTYNSIGALLGVDEPLWYIYELCVLYILFYMCTKIGREKNIYYITGIIVLFLLFAYFTCIPQPYYGSTLAFPLGMVMFRIFDVRKARIKSLLCPVVSVMTLGMSLVVFFYKEDTWAGETLARNIATVSFCVLVVYIMQHFVLRGTILNWLGTISLEIFLIHEYVEYAMAKMGIYTAVGDYVFLLLVLAVTIVLSIPLHWFNKKLLALVLRK